MPITRAMADDKFQQLFAAIATMSAEMKSGQEEMKKEIFSRQEEMKGAISAVKEDVTKEIFSGQEEMKACQEEMKTEIFSRQEEMKTEIFSRQEEMKSEIFSRQEEMQKSIAAISAGQEEFKSHLLATVEESVRQVENKFEGKLETVEQKFNSLEGNMCAIKENLEKKIEILEKKNLEENLSVIEEKLEKKMDILEKKLSSGNISGDLKCASSTSRPLIKLSTYDGKSSWQVYKTQFAIVANANGWDCVTKACQLAASLRAEAADILQTLPEEQRLDFNALSNALELRFGEKCVKDYSRLQLKSRQQKPAETLQELATDVERLAHLAFSDCPAETREILSLQYFVDGIRDAEIQKALRMADVKDLKSALVYAMKYEAAQQASRKERHPIRAATVQEPEDTIAARLDELSRQINAMRRNSPDKKQSLKCWNCGGEGHIRRNCRTRQDTEAKTAPRKEEGN